MCWKTTGISSKYLCSDLDYFTQLILFKIEISLYFNRIQVILKVKDKVYGFHKVDILPTGKKNFIFLDINKTSVPLQSHILGWQGLYGLASVHRHPLETKSSCSLLGDFETFHCKAVLSHSYLLEFICLSSTTKLQHFPIVSALGESAANC